MAKKSKDEEYLDSLLNEIVSNDLEQDDSSDDFDKWFDEELKNIAPSNLDFNLSESDGNIDDLFNSTESNEYKEEEQSIAEEIPNEEKQNDIGDKTGEEEISDTEDKKYIQESSGEGNGNNDNFPDISVDGNEIDVNDVADDGDIDNIFDLFDSDELKNVGSDTKIQENPDNAPAVKEGYENDADNNESVGEYVPNVQTDIPNTEDINPDTKNDSKKGKKKKSIFGKLFSKKKKDEDTEAADQRDDMADILNETGSAFDDMALDAKTSSFVSDDSSKNKSNGKNMDIFGDEINMMGIDSLDDIPDKDEEKKGKKKKEKKEKKKKEKKIKPPKEKKIKKAKKPVVDEYIRISPLAVVLSVSVIILLVVGIYLGSTTFSYKGKVDKATNYYVQKEYTKAYNLLAGLDLKASDKDFYLQVENIMHVEKHINDFDAYIEIEKYAFALEALSRGIMDYDKYYDRGRELGTTQVLDSKLDEIDTLLKTYYGLSVDEMRNINVIDSISEYSKVINEKAKNIKIPSEE